MGSKTIMSHDERLRTLGTNVRATVDRIVSVWGRATDADKERGALWYADAGVITEALSAQTGYSREAVAAVIAHLSPRTRWARNIAGATALVYGQEPAGCIGMNVQRARRALMSPDPLGTLNGPKVRRFAANILGDRDAVTVDVWAMRVACGDRFDDLELILGRVGVYEAVEHAYQVSARRIGCDPVTVQATTWIVVRNGRAG
ncbi:hypothetical protein [Micromonospora sp. NPDC049240]|uniref:DUF7178 family protein n=1 Tax=Micromonospora sp. NPDC049240 TaxID=3155151 RepID=UPI00340BC762